MAFDANSARILDQLRRYLATIVDDHTRLTVAAWARAWDDVAPELSAALDELAINAGDKPLTRSQIVKARRLNAALDLIERRLSLLVDTSAQSVINNLRAVVDNAGHTTDRLVASQLPVEHQPASTWSRVDPDQVDAIVNRATEQITKTSFPLSGQATAAMKRNLIRGLLVGSNPREVARRMVRQSQQGFNGGLTRALNIARTEMLDAQRAASALAEKAHTDVLAGWIWSSELGPRTCPACFSMHGSVHSLDEPGPDGHQSCRCARVPKTKPWSELGFNIPEPKSIFPNAETKFNTFSASQQVDILGPSKYAAWKAGKFPIASWGVKQQNPGWRDSWVPARAPRTFLGQRRKDVLSTRKPAVAKKLRAKLAAGDLTLDEYTKIHRQMVTAELGDWAEHLPLKPAGLLTRGLDDISRDVRLTNPNYDPATAFGVNCQRCVSVYELRRRVDVEISAAPRPATEHSTANATFGKWFPGMVARSKAYKPDRAQPGWAAATQTWVTGVAEKWPEGSRGMIWFYRPQGAGHVFSVERSKAGVTFVDPQGNVVNPDYWDQMREVHIARVDDLPVDSSVMKAIDPSTRGGQP